jgi:hypothetical protein
MYEDNEAEVFARLPDGRQIGSVELESRHPRAHLDTFKT